MRTSFLFAAILKVKIDFVEIPDRKADHISAMFSDIAPRYDFLNHLFSFGIDKCWRKRMAREITKCRPARVLDIATGTGDLALALHRAEVAKIVGVDISEGMLEIARSKTIRNDIHPSNVEFMLASAEVLPFPDNSFDAVTIGFGVRNFEHLQKGLREIQRVLQPGGQLAVLEFSTPQHFPVKQLYHFYFHTIIPVVGHFVSKHQSAYSYLPSSVSNFPQRGDFLNQLQQAGFIDMRYRNLSCGIAAIYTAEKSKFPNK